MILDMIKLVRLIFFEKLNELTRFTDNNVTYKKWYCGHWHQNKKIDDKHICVYDILTVVD